jgi:hypothetical protein
VLSIQGKKTGWFHVEKLNGRWFFVTPEGNAFFSLGITHSENAVKKDELDLFNKVYGGSEEKVGEFFLSKFKEWHFNSSGYEPLPIMEKRIPYVATNWIDGPARYNQRGNKIWVDLFSDPFIEKLKVTTAKATARHINNPYCLGYVFTDLPIWNLEQARRLKIDTYVDFMRKLDNTQAGKQRYLAFLTEKYGSKLDSFNLAYGFKINSATEFGSCNFAELKRNKSIDQDDEEFLNIIADHYYSIVTREVRKNDPNHLIMGDRLILSLGDEKSEESKGVHNSILRTAAKYLDVISYQPFGSAVKTGNYIDAVSNLTGKPVILIDTITTPITPPQNGDTTEYEKASGANTYDFYIDAASSKSCIGIHRCTVRDYEVWNPANYRRGLLKNDDTEYPILVDYAKKTNLRCFEIVYLGKLESGDNPPLPK